VDEAGVEVVTVDTGEVEVEAAGLEVVLLVWFVELVGTVLPVPVDVPVVVPADVLQDAVKAIAVSVAPAAVTPARLRNCLLENLVILRVSFAWPFSFRSFLTVSPPKFLIRRLFFRFHKILRFYY
jgi:hypothetical protein